MPLTDEQLTAGNLAREVFAKECTPQRLRERWATGEADKGLWDTLAGVGLLDLAEAELVLVFEEAGYAGVPDPLVETVVAGGRGLAALKLAGSPFVLDADRAQVLIVEDGGALQAVRAGGFTAQRVDSEDRARRLFSVEVTQPGTPLAMSPAEARTRAAAATAAMLNGVSRRLLDMSCEHVRTREQFGRPVGSFQAVQHKLASVHVLVEQARAAAWHAAGQAGSTEASSVAKVLAGEAARLASTEALQCHAGIGFTWEHDLHLWLKRAHALEAAYGTTREHRAALAVALLDGEGR